MSGQKGVPAWCKPGSNNMNIDLQPVFFFSTAHGCFNDGYKQQTMGKYCSSEPRTERTKGNLVHRTTQLPAIHATKTILVFSGPHSCMFWIGFDNPLSNGFPNTCGLCK
jgi:hypothetical protein